MNGSEVVEAVMTSFELVDACPESEVVEAVMTASKEVAGSYYQVL